MPGCTCYFTLLHLLHLTPDAQVRQMVSDYIVVSDAAVIIVLPIQNVVVIPVYLRPYPDSMKVDIFFQPPVLNPI